MLAERILALRTAKRLQRDMQIDVSPQRIARFITEPRKLEACATKSAKMLANQREKSLDVRGFERAAFAPLRCRWQIANAEQLAIFPNPGIAIIGSDLLRLAPGMNGDEPVGNGCRDMGGTAVDTHSETRSPNEPDQLQNARVVEQVDAIVGDGNLAFGPTDEDHASRRERVAKFLDGEVAE